jgi:site-specific DNA-cytosine methylase
MSSIPNITKNALGVSVLRLGEHGANKRVWITNQKLQKTFAKGDKIQVTYLKDQKCIHIAKSEEKGNHTVSGRQNGIPIIDIKNQNVEETFGQDIEKVEVLFFENEIVIKIAKTEHFKNKRLEKTGLNTFELFCGAGTLSHFFKREGFNIKGGLELNEDYLALFHANNPNEEIYSISGRLEDVHTSYFPKDIDVVLSGIPCTNYSSSNKKLKEAQKAKREGREYCEEEIKKEFEAESLTFYVLMAIKAMNPRTVVVEEVVEYAESPASMMLRTVLGHMGYQMSETVEEGKHTKRKRWVLVANMGQMVKLDNLIQDDEKTIEDFLETSIEDRVWQTAEENPRVSGMISKGLGIRSCLPSDTKSNTFTTHSTRHTEPILKHPTQELYSEFTTREIANIHGISKDFLLDERKGISRQVIGQGVTDMFGEVAKRIKEVL